MSTAALMAAPATMLIIIMTSTYLELLKDGQQVVFLAGSFYGMISTISFKRTQEARQMA